MWKNKRGYLWITLALFAITLSMHWTFAWFSYLEEQKEHNQPIEISGYFNMTFRDTMENWQSEFLQLIWQVAGLSILLYVGSPQSKEGDERKEEKMDLIIKILDQKNGNAMIKELDTKYPKK
ncbi:MAG TPA: DUF6766 family protein [Nitrososphaeraceae archaeon]